MSQSTTIGVGPQISRELELSTFLSNLCYEINIIAEEDCDE